MGDLLDPDLLDDDPFEVDHQAAHVFKHPRLGLQDVYDVWTSDPLFYPAKPPAHWLMVAEVGGVVSQRSVARSVAMRLLRVSRPTTEGIAMSTEMTPDEEYEFYAKAENQEPQGRPRRRTARLTSPIPVRFPPELLEEIKRRARDDDRSVSSWIRRAVEQELHRSA